MKKIKTLSTAILLFVLLLSCGKESTKPETKTINMTLSVTTLNFGNVVVGSTKDSTVTITNESGSSANLTGTVSVSGNQFAMLTSGDFDLSPGASKSFTIRFTPSASQGATGSMEITHNATNEKSPLTIDLSGNGESPIAFTVSTTQLDFGVVAEGQSVDDTVTIQNEATSRAALTGSLSVSGAGFALVNASNSFSLAPGATLDIIVRFTPGTANDYSGTLSITHNADLQSSPTAIALKGSKNRSQEVEQLLSSGWNYFQQKDYENARTEFAAAQLIVFNQAIYDSLQSEVENGLGWCNTYLQKYATALNQFNLVFNHNVSGISLLTRTYAAAGATLAAYSDNDYQTAILNALDVLDGDPVFEFFPYDPAVTAARIRLILVQSYYSVGDFENAAAQLDILDPDGAPHSTDPAILLQQIQQVAGSI